MPSRYIRCLASATIDQTRNASPLPLAGLPAHRLLQVGRPTDFAAPEGGGLAQALDAERHRLAVAAPVCVFRQGRIDLRLGGWRAALDGPRGRDHWVRGDVELGFDPVALHLGRIGRRGHAHVEIDVDVEGLHSPKQPVKPPIRIERVAEPG